MSERSLRIGTRPLERALDSADGRRSTDRTFARYRTASVVVRENQWRAARTALASAVQRRAIESQPEGRHCFTAKGISAGSTAKRASKAKDTDAARQQLTAAVTAFRQAAELRQNWPDPFIGLMRTFVALDDVERGADALAQAQRYAYTAVSRDWAQLADGYYSRAEKLSVTDDLDSLTRAADAYSHAIDAYSKVVGIPTASQKLRDAQRHLHQVQDRIGRVAAPSSGTTETMTWAAPIRSAIVSRRGDSATVAA